MTRIQARFKGVVARYGESLGGAKGVVVPLTLARSRDYLTDPEIADAPRPMWVATVGYDHPADEGDTLDWGARTILVKKAVNVRFAGATVARLLILLSTSGSSGGEGGGGAQNPVDPNLYAS